MQPIRVIINKDGEAVTPERAAQMGIGFDVIFQRNDGWTLGAEKRFKGIAYAMWSDCWTHYMFAADPEWIPISKWGHS